VNVAATSDVRVSVEPIPLLVGEPIRGGEAFIFEDATDPDRYLIKQFHVGNRPTPRQGAAAQHIADLGRLSAAIRPSEWRMLVDRFSWPLKIYGDSVDSIDGVQIPKATPEFFIRYATQFETLEKPQNLAFLISDYLNRPAIQSAPFRTVDFEDRVELAFQFLISFEALWRVGYLYGDFSANNLLWAKSKPPKVFVIDAETCRQPGGKGPHSPDWFPPAALGESYGSDRSLLALLIWRVFAVDQHATPNSNGSSGELDRLSRAFRADLIQVFSQGDEVAYRRIRETLSRMRPTTAIDHWFDWAVATGFARLVLEMAPPVASAGQQEILDAAREQIELERSIEESVGRARVLKLATCTPLPGFEFDLMPVDELGVADAQGIIVRELAFSGNYLDIANRVATSSGQVAIDGIVKRSIEHALVEVGSPRLRETTIGVASNVTLFEWSWPGNVIVTHALLEVVDDNDVVLSVRTADRKRNRPSLRIDLSQLPTSAKKLRVRYAMKTRETDLIVAPVGASHPLSPKGQIGRTVPRSEPESWRVLERDAVPFQPKFERVPLTPPPSATDSTVLPSNEARPRASGLTGWIRRRFRRI
jgi:hypothetical protein